MLIIHPMRLCKFDETFIFFYLGRNSTRKKTRTTKFRIACYPVAAKNANGIIISNPFMVMLPNKTYYGSAQK